MDQNYANGHEIKLIYQIIFCLSFHLTILRFIIHSGYIYILF